MNKTEQEWLKATVDSIRDGDNFIDQMRRVNYDASLDLARSSGYPVEDEGPRAAIQNGAALQADLVALAGLVLHFDPRQLAELDSAVEEVHGLTHQIWRQYAQIGAMLNRLRAAMVEVHHAVTGDPLPPTPSENDGEVDFEFWGFTRDLEGKPNDYDTILAEILDGVAQLKVLAGVEATDPPPAQAA